MTKTTTNALRSGYGYIRVSTHDQEELSPDSQEKLLRKFAQDNNIILEYIYIDSGISGRKADKRPAFQEMIARAKSKEHPVDVILVWKFSRFARNQEESIVYKSLLRKAAVEVLSVSEPITNDPFGSLIERIIEWMDEYYSIRLSGEVKRGMTENAQRGRYQATAPLGYRNVPGGLEIIPEEADLVKMIFRNFQQDHMGYSTIASYLNDRGIKTKKGGIWENRTVKYVLQNPIYKGYVRWNVGRNQLRGPTASSPDMIFAKGNHPIIIPEDIFDQVQEEIARLYRQPKSRPAESYGHWLGNLVRCSSCGSALTYSPAHKGFQCVSYGKGSKCRTSHYISANLLEQAIIHILEEKITSGNIEYQKERVDEPEQDNEKTILLDILEKLEGREKRIKAAYQDGIDTLAEYKENKRLIAQEKERIQKQLADLQEKEAPNTSGSHDSDMLLRIRGVVDIIKSPAAKEVKSRAFRSICEKIVYDKKAENLDIYLVFREL